MASALFAGRSTVAVVFAGMVPLRVRIAAH
jgi:hypothetical protein